MAGYMMPSRKSSNRTTLRFSPRYTRVPHRFRGELVAAGEAQTRFEMRTSPSSDLPRDGGTLTDPPSSPAAARALEPAGWERLRPTRPELIAGGRGIRHVGTEG